MSPSPLPNNPAPPMPIQPEYSPASSGNTGNHVLDEISAAHASLSPQAQQAIEGAHGMLGISPAHSDPALAASAAPSPELAVPGVSGPRGPLPDLSPQIPASRPMNASRFPSVGMVAGGPEQAGALLAQNGTPTFPVSRGSEMIGPQSADAMSAAQPLLPGLRELGNTDLDHRPILKNPDGSISTMSTASFGTDKGETLIPTVINGKRLSEPDALNAYRQSGKHMGIFDTPEDADAYSQSMHDTIAGQMFPGSVPQVAPIASDTANSGKSGASTPPMPVNAVRQEGARLNAAPLDSRTNASAHTSADSGRPGIEQIHNPWLRGLATAGDVIASGVFPRIGQFVPGTSAHHQLLVNQNENAQGAENANAKSDAEVAREAAQTKNLESEAENRKDAGTFQTAGGGIYNLKTHEWEVEPPEKDKDQLLEIDPTKGAALGIKPNAEGKFYIPPQAAGELLKPAVAKEPKEGEIPLGEAVPNINAAIAQRYQILHPGAKVPDHYILPAGATQKDFDRTDKLIEGEEKAFGTKENHDQTTELRKQTMALAAGNRENKDQSSLKASTLKEFGPAVDSAERFNVMTHNYEDAVRNHDQQAMLSLLANHIGMTMGLQKGARINQAMYSEAQKSLPWLQGLEAKFDKDGYLSGVTLSPQQMQQMVSLGRERFSQDVTKARNNSRYLGAKDDGPERTPSKATINYYTSMANGDAAKAKQLAAVDGWSIQ